MTLISDSRKQASEYAVLPLDDDASMEDVARYVAAKEFGVALDIVGDDDDGEQVEFHKSGSAFFDVRKGSDGMHEISSCAYCINEVDSQNDFVDSIEELKKASASWLQNGGVVKLMHEQDSECRVVESFVSDSPMTYRGTKIDKGCWVVTLSVPDDVFAKVSDGTFRGLSIGGTCRVVEV